MKIEPMSFINPDKKYQECNACTPSTRHKCKNCYGTGKVCPDCLNDGHLLGKPTVCDCGMKNQKAYFFELKSLDLQPLIHVPHSFDGDISKADTYLRKFLPKYRVVSDRGYIYSRFMFANIKEDDLIIARLNMLRGMNRTDSLQGFIYISTTSLEDNEYAESINEILMDNRSAVLVFLGCSHIIHTAINPYLKLLNKNLHRPVIFFSTAEWHNLYKYFNILWVDKNVEAKEQ